MENLHTIEEVFSNRVFRIPDYQRGYAWSNTQWQDLLQDMELLPEKKDHFTGTLILHTPPDNHQVRDEEGTTYAVYDIIDGQQRLTTLVLLLNAIRDEMQSMDALAKLASGLQKKYIAVKGRDGQPIPKLTLNRDTHKFFYNTVLEQSPDIEGPTIRSHSLLAGAKSNFTKYLKDKQKETGAGYPDWLEAQYLKITQQLTLIVYAVNVEADAWVIFETMNDRGKPITELEKVKNYLLYLSAKLELEEINHSLPAKINSTWTHIFEHLMTANLGRVENEDQLLRAHWLMAYDYQPKNWGGSRSIKEHFSLRRYKGRHKQLLQDILTYIDTLANAATAYCDLLNPTHSSAFNAYKSNKSLQQQIANMSAKLPRVGAMAHFIPLLMAVRLKYPADGEKYLAAVSLSEKYIFRVYKWIEWRTHTDRVRLFRLGHRLFNGGKFNAILDELTRILLARCSEKQFRDEFQLDDEENDWFNWSGLAYFLYEFEEHLAQAEGREVRMLWSMVEGKPNTIEHILPQTPRKNSQWRRDFSKKARKKYTHDIGNLCLTQDNSILSNKSFADKKGTVGQQGCYANSIILMEKALAKYNQWTETELLTRHKEIEDWAIARWHVEPPSAVPPPPQSPDKVKAVEHLAEQHGIGDAFRAILEMATKHQLRPRPHKWCVVYAPPTDRTQAVFTVWPKSGYLEVGVWHGQFAKFFDITKVQTKSILGEDRNQYITEEDVDEFTESLDDLFKTAARNGGKSL